MKDLHSTETFHLFPIGYVSSDLKALDDCPLQEYEDAPQAYVELNSSYCEGIKDIAVGDKLIIITWLHLANRGVLKCHKRNLVGSDEYGVFSTRSPDRPNPIGLHTVTVLEIIDKQKLRIFPMEALNGTPVIDIKPYI